MNAAKSLKNVVWGTNGCASYASRRPGFGVMNSKGQFISSDGVSPSSWSSKAVATDLAPYADEFDGYCWLNVK